MNNMATNYGITSLQLTDEAKSRQVEDVLRCLTLTSDTVHRIREIFMSELELGLSKNPRTQSSLQMENTYIPELPDGTEEGQYLALDLGSTNFRVVLLELASGRIVREDVKYYNVPENLRLGEGVFLFDFLAECIHDFLQEKKLLGKKFPLGFTFSFPMEQKSLNVGILLSWTKAFTATGVIGEDAVRMLSEAIQRRQDLDVEVVAVLNDTTGTLVQGAFMDHQTAVGLILGSGSNACYIERADRVHKWEGSHQDVKEVIIDIEWGAFGDNGVLDFIKTDFDRIIDSKSLLPKSFTFEKYFSGTFLGAIVEVVLSQLIRDKLLFSESPDVVLADGSFTSKLVSKVEEDNLKNTSCNTCQILKDWNLSFNADDVAIIKYVCSVVTIRAALLVSICLSCLVNRLDREELTVAIDGSLFRYHPRLHLFMEKHIKEMAPGKKFKLMAAEDGSGKGGALVAAIAKRLQQRK